MKNLLLVFGSLYILGCSSPKKEPTLFTLLDADETGVDFRNDLAFDQKFNIYTYRNFYNGGGVALGDINNDGLVDIYFSSNQGPNKLYLNKGNFKFEDISENAGVAGTKAWSTGVSMADVNGDGLLDIYVCNSGDVKGDNKENELFINNGNLTFTEQAKEYGVADRGFTTHAAFFDYDRDSDLDLYILNNSYQAIGSFNLRKNERPKRDSLGGDKLLRNDNGKFIDVSEQAGIYGSIIGFGLGVTVGDIDKDGWPDIYVSNDFFERDYIYLNNHNGTFRECLPEQMKSISGASMGADMADINNDGWSDIFVTEMLPNDNARIKTVTTFDNWDRYQYNVGNDYYHQFTRNMLQLNNGDNTFSEIGRLSGVEATDWSWGALLFDMDNDGRKDIFVANGIYQDLTNQDYLQYVSNEEVIKSIIAEKGVDYKSLVELIPSTPVPDFAFHNEGDLRFKDMAAEWGLGEPNFSNGSAYGDLDNDGDLDLVINKVNSPASIARNESNTMRPEHHYLKFELKGLGANTSAWGTKITIYAGGDIFYQEQMPNRGFESSMDPRPNFGLGKWQQADSVLVQWPGGTETVLKNVKTNQVVQLAQSDSREAPTPVVKKATQVFGSPDSTRIAFRHKESEFVDFDRDRLVYHMLSSESPRLAQGDVNGDNRIDIFIGGAKDNPGAIFIQDARGQFKELKQPAFEEDKGSEDQSATFFDADGDRDLDLYVASGSNEFSTSSVALADRLYLNNGSGVFKKSNQVLPTFNFENTSTVKACDFDRDGDTDLFVGIRSHPFLYGAPMNGYLLQNDGTGQFTDASEKWAPALKGIGMITDAAWADVDGDKDADLLIIGEYMPITLFLNNGSQFVNQTDQVGLTKTNGWWRRLKASDVDRDGDIDFVVANYGLNSRLRASVEKPVSLFVNDFDRNGTVEQILCSYQGEVSYPIVLRHDLMAQIPALKKKYLKYDSYKNQTITDIFSPKEMENALKLDAYELASVVLSNDGAGKFSVNALPVEAQFAPMYGIEVADFDADGALDIVMGGNLYRVKPELGRYDASYGVFLRGDGHGQFTSVNSRESGLKIDGEVRDLMVVSAGSTRILVVARNNQSVVTIQTK